METKEFIQSLEKKSKKIPLAVTAFVALLPEGPIGKAISLQLIKNAAAFTAAYRNAQKPMPAPDVRKKITVCIKELSETHYWLGVIKSTELVSARHTKPLYAECAELLSLFTALGKKAAPHAPGAPRVNTRNTFIRAPEGAAPQTAFNPRLRAGEFSKGIKKTETKRHRI